MSIRHRIVLSIGLAAVALGPAACGGKTAGAGEGSATETSSGSGSGTSLGTSVSTVVETTVIGTSGTNGSCVDFELGPSDLECASDGDCNTVRTGTICSGECSCGSTPVNMSGSDRFGSATSGLTLDACPCAFPGEPRCIGGQCAVCGFGPDQPAGCADGGGAVDAGADVSTTSDAGTCFDLDLSSLDTSCETSSDCVGAMSGELCSTDNCRCNTSSISADAASAYDQLLAEVPAMAGPGPFCNCPAAWIPTCIAHQCVTCGPGSTQAGCSDGGL